MPLPISMDLRRQPLHEVAIVRDEDQRAAVLDQRVEQHFLRVEIEVVGRLVEQQGVRRPQQHARHREARALAAGQHPHALVDVVAGEQKNRRGCSESSAPSGAAIRTRASAHGRRRIHPRRFVLGEAYASRRCGRACVPESGASSPESIRISVDLPTPLGPTSAMRSPRSMCRLRSLKIAISAVRLAHVLELDDHPPLWRRPES